MRNGTYPTSADALEAARFAQSIGGANVTRSVAVFRVETGWGWAVYGASNWDKVLGEGLYWQLGFPDRHVLEAFVSFDPRVTEVQNGTLPAKGPTNAE
jgi:hypothetical protein